MNPSILKKCTIFLKLSKGAGIKLPLKSGWINDLQKIIRCFEKADLNHFRSSHYTLSFEMYLFLKGDHTVFL